MTHQAEIAEDPGNPDDQDAGSSAAAAAVGQGSGRLPVGPGAAGTRAKPLEGFGTLYRNLTTRWMVRQR